MLQKIELLKARDFGEIITDTFIFIRQNLKPLISCFFIFSGFFLIGSAILGAIQQTKAINVLNGFSNFQSESRLYETNPFSLFGVEYLFSMLFLLFNFIAIHVTVYSYMCLYKEKGNVPPTPREVWGYFKYYYFKILGSGILLVILLIIATLLCIVPGIYLYPILALIFPVMIFENTTLGYAFNRSFKLIKDNWWLTFGSLIIIGIIVYFAILAILLPITILNFSGLIFHPKGGLHISATLSIITSILQHLCQVFYIVPLVTISLCYFNLTEKLDSPGLMGRIDQLGNTGPEGNLPVEEY